jgi:HTH-type transcriptional regulator/antitoxin HigA
MIKNEKRYRITKAQVRRCEEALDQPNRQERPSNITPRPWQAQRDAATSQLQEVQQQIGAYERLPVSRSKDLQREAIEDLPSTLIRARIASGMTQEGLAHRLDVKTQQVNRVLKVAQALGFRLPEPAQLVRNR